MKEFILKIQNLLNVIVDNILLINLLFKGIKILFIYRKYNLIHVVNFFQINSFNLKTNLILINNKDYTNAIFVILNL